MVRAAKLEPEALIKAIKAGDIYASSGVTLRDVRYDAADKSSCSSKSQPKKASNTPRNSSARKLGYDPASEPRVDADGKPIRTTRKYSADVGQVFATVERHRRPRTNSPATNSTSAPSSPPPSRTRTLVRRPARTSLDAAGRLARTACGNRATSASMFGNASGFLCFGGRGLRFLGQLEQPSRFAAQELDNHPVDPVMADTCKPL